MLSTSMINLSSKEACLYFTYLINTVMAIANDIGYEEIFRFQLLNKINENDLFIGISG